MVVDHALDLLPGQAIVVGDGDIVCLSGGPVRGRDLHNTVGVDTKGHLNLGTTRGREPKLAEKVVVLRTGTLTLVNPDARAGLVVTVSGENLGGEDTRVLGREGSVLLSGRTSAVT